MRTLSNANDSANLAARLLTEFQAGDIRAFSQLYDLYVDVLFNYGHRLTTDTGLLKDCIQEVFIKVYNKGRDLGTIDNFKSYMFISLKNKICDELRRRIYISNTTIYVDSMVANDVENVYLRIEEEQIKGQTVQSLMKRLSPRQREALTLYYIEEKKYEDICEIMSMNYQSVRNLMYRGLVKLRSIAK